MKKNIFIYYSFIIFLFTSSVFSAPPLPSCNPGSSFTWVLDGSANISSGIYNAGSELSQTTVDQSACFTYSMRYSYIEYTLNDPQTWQYSSYSFSQMYKKASIDICTNGRNENTYQCIPDCNLTINSYDYATNTCEPLPYDPETKNPYGTCKLNYAMDTSGICSPDDDGDGVPNLEDDYPTDPTRTDNGSDGSNDDTGEDCSAYCGIEHYTDCVDDTFWGSDSGSHTAEVWYVACDSCLKTSDIKFGITCAEFEGQQTSPDVPEDCSVLPSFGGYTNVTITRSQSECRIIQNSRGGGNSYALPNCSTGTVACYYAYITEVPESNSTTPDNPTDTNGTTSDTETLVTAVDSVRNSVDNVNDSVKNVVTEVTHSTDAIKDNTKQLKGSLDDLKTVNSKGFGDVQTSVNEGINTLGNKIDGMNDNIGTKLNGITDAINNKETFPQESQGVLQYDDIEVDGMLGSSNAGLEAQFNSFTEGYATDLFSLQSVVLPVSPNCGCTDPSIDVVLAGHSFHQDVEVCSSLDSLFAVMRPLLWFAFLVTTLFGFFRKD